MFCFNKWGIFPGPDIETKSKDIAQFVVDRLILSSFLPSKYCAFPIIIKLWLCGRHYTKHFMNITLFNLHTHTKKPCRGDVLISISQRHKLRYREIKQAHVWQVAKPGFDSNSVWFLRLSKPVTCFPLWVLTHQPLTLTKCLKTQRSWRIWLRSFCFPLAGI